MTISDEENPNEHDESQNSLPQSRKRTLIGALGNISKKNKYDRSGSNHVFFIDVIV
jgi:hypothetical protein